VTDLSGRPFRASPIFTRFVESYLVLVCFLLRGFSQVGLIFELRILQRSFIYAPPTYFISAPFSCSSIDVPPDPSNAAARLGELHPRAGPLTFLSSAVRPAEFVRVSRPFISPKLTYVSPVVLFRLHFFLPGPCRDRFFGVGDAVFLCLIRTVKPDFFPSRFHLLVISSCRVSAPTRRFLVVAVKKILETRSRDSVPPHFPLSSSLPPLRFSRLFSSETI